MRDDAQLLHAFVTTRSEDAFKELVLAHIDPVYSVAVRVLNGDSALAQDVTQTVFADFARKAASIRNGSAVEPGCVAAHSSWRRARCVRNGGVDRGRGIRVHERAKCQRSRWEEIKGVVDEFVQTLPAADREAVTLRFLHGWELKRVGSALGITMMRAKASGTRPGEAAARPGAARVHDQRGGLLTAISSQDCQPRHSDWPRRRVRLC